MAIASNPLKPLLLSAACALSLLSAAARADQPGPDERAALRQKAEALVAEAGKRNEARAQALYAAAGDLYMEAWTKHSRALCEAKQAGCERSEEILYNAARAYQAARDMPRSIEARRALIDPRYNLHNTQPGLSALYELGNVHHAMGSYEEAASWYERFALTAPALEKAAEALTDATVLRLALHQLPAAIADADAFYKYYGMKHATRAARIHYAVASTMLDRGDARGAEAKLTSAMRSIDEHATLDVKATAHAARARALLALGKKKDAVEDYKAVRALTEGGALQAFLKRTGEDSTSLRELGRLLDARGEALFFFAEEKKRALFAAKRPSYKGAGNLDDARRYVAGELTSFQEWQRSAAVEVEGHYRTVLDIQPAPPPRWVVAAAASVAEMYSKLAADLVIIPPPSAWRKKAPPQSGKTPEELVAEWRAMLTSAGEPERLKAKAAFVTCAQRGAKFQVASDHARRCAAWLTSHDPTRYPKLDELLPAPVPAFAQVPWAPVPDPRE